MFSQGDLEIKGVVLDKFKKPVKFAAVSVPKLYLGTATTEEGKFSIILSESDYDESDMIEIASFGNKTIKITVKEYLELKEKIIVVGVDFPLKNNDKSAVTNKAELKTNSVKSTDISSKIKKKPATEYLELANKYIERNTINSLHELKMLYSRFSVEDGKARFLVEHVVNVLDAGPVNGNYIGVDILTGRKSEDNRLVKKKFSIYPVNKMSKADPQRSGLLDDTYNWKITGTSFYDGEDIVIIEGKKNNNKGKLIRYYIGIKTYGIFKIETQKPKSVYIYSKNEEGKLHLSYHNRVRTGKVILTEKQKELLGTTKKNITESYKHEVFVIGYKKLAKGKFNPSDYKMYKEDFGDIKIKYNQAIWKKLNLPPQTEFYKNSVEELEKISGKPIEKQFRK